MGDWYGSNKNSGSSRRIMKNNEEFQEEDIWSVLSDQNEEDTSTGSKLIEQPTVVSRKLPTAIRMIPTSHKSERVPQEPVKMARESAPVCIPDWSKIYGKNVARETPRGEDEDGDEDGNVETMPPHEWMAIKLAKSKKTSFSVCEGAGRTLKGRDLRKVRHDVLTRTGFLEF